jgi:hypothetical protein
MQTGRAVSLLCCIILLGSQVYAQAPDENEKNLTGDTEASAALQRSTLAQNFVKSLNYDPQKTNIPPDSDVLDEPWIVSPASGTENENGLILPPSSKEPASINYCSPKYKKMYKWSIHTWKAICNKQVYIGMNKQQAIMSWGFPDDINTTINRLGRQEQWVYSHSSYLYFDNDTLTTIQN